MHLTTMKKTKKAFALPTIGNTVQQNTENKPYSMNKLLTDTNITVSINNNTNQSSTTNKNMSAPKLRIYITFVRCALTGYQGNDCIKARNSVIV